MGSESSCFFVTIQLNSVVCKVCSTCLKFEGTLEEPARAIACPLNPILPLVSQQELLPVVLSHEPDEGLCDVSVADPGPCEHVVSVVRMSLLSGEDQPKSSCRKEWKLSPSILVHHCWVECNSRQGVITRRPEHYMRTSSRVHDGVICMCCLNIIALGVPELNGEADVVEPPSSNSLLKAG